MFAPRLARVVSRRTTVLLAAGGVVGPLIFVIDWAVLGAVASHYSPAHDAISRLAATHAPTRAAMTGGFVLYGAGIILYAAALRRTLAGSPAWLLAGATGVMTFGLAAFPLGTPLSGDIHAVFAGFGYASLAALPLVAARALPAVVERSSVVVISVAAGLGCAVCLLATTFAPLHGLIQRVGLSVGDAWVVASALMMVRLDRRNRGRSQPGRPQPGAFDRGDC